MARACQRCERPIARGEPHFRFALALQGEAEVIDAAAAIPDDPAALLRLLEEADPDELEAGVHEEHAGVLCNSCRTELRVFLGLTRRLQ